ncbi:MAG TPA: uroporphyrinogen-III C-methyltransferase [Terriglobales bacterium]|nr:uroporphyrinogen-III C-methyltransferase [Terriglobales bacterium]
MNGKVYLVGAGPGDPEMLTLKALKVLKRADVVLHDELVSPEIIAFVPSTARIQNVGKRCGGKSTSQGEINSLLVQYALLGLQVVRLKGGDPFIFGRGGEELQALREAGIEVEVVPGITAALGAAAAVQIPLTHRGIASSLVFLTGHHAENANSDHWPDAIAPNTTVVVYMPGRNYGATAQKLRAAGVAPETPCAIVSHIGSRNESMCQTTIAELASTAALPAPSLLVVGDVVRFAQHRSRGEQFSQFVADRLEALQGTRTQEQAL